MSTWYNDFAFHVGNHVGICRMPTWVRKTEIWSVKSYSERNNFIKKFYEKCGPKTSSRPFCVCKELTTTSIGKWNIWSNLLILELFQISIIELVQISILTCPDYFLQRMNGLLFFFLTTFFIEFFDKKKLSYVT